MARHKTYDCSAGCPVEATLDLIGGKWKGLILYHLLDGTLRFGALRKCIPGVTARMLTQQLRELEASGLVHRKVYAEVPPRVDYSLTALGESLREVVLSLKAWGEVYLGRGAQRPQRSALVR
ncbi:Transcriptional regulator, HxlR family [Myxococcus hansupus]|uniref:Transcriptional regulator, HxlR family n=1 Tax=Pseudomyxococcus hansupus TaxID=1297742 RepID=A0A0H4WSP2_9BACT|nr:helix-turn-helix domain-containing protein [Myxococcus hansupus]AKQ64573.1 Transcriptional regulator, HxlR family [Myxococcus hansupus]